MKGFRILCVISAMLVSAALHAQGIVMVEQQTRDGKSSTSQIQLDKTHMRVESRASGESQAFIFDETAKALRVINLDKKTYMELDAATMQQMQAQMAQLQAKLQNLPPQQRAILEQALRGRGGMLAAGGPAVKVEYRQSGSDKVGQWACTKYEGYQGQQKAMEVCTVDPKELGLAPADFEVAKHLVEFLQGFLPQAANQVVVSGSTAEQGFSGVPVRRTSYVNGRVDTVSEITAVRREAIPASVFDVPSGFKRETPMGRGR